jgi:hypothetical protein
MDIIDVPGFLDPKAQLDQDVSETTINILKEKEKVAAILILIANGKLSADIELMIRVYAKQLRLGQDPERWKHVYFIITHVDYDSDRHSHSREPWLKDIFA